MTSVPRFRESPPSSFVKEDRRDVDYTIVHPALTDNKELSTKSKSMAHNIVPYEIEPEADIDTGVDWLRGEYRPKKAAAKAVQMRVVRNGLACAYFVYIHYGWC